jgi:hypothetical protein
VSFIYEATGVTVQFAEGAVGVPGDLRVTIKRMSADGVAEEVHFIVELLHERGFFAKGGPYLLLLGCLK